MSLAGMDREVREMRNHALDVEEGLQPGQLRDGGLLRKAQGGVLLWSGRKGWSIGRSMGALGEYIDWYNEKRIMISLGGLSPAQYRRSLGLAVEWSRFPGQ